MSVCTRKSLFCTFGWKYDIFKRPQAKISTSKMGFRILGPKILQLNPPNHCPQYLISVPRVAPGQSGPGADRMAHPGRWGGGVAPKTPTYLVFRGSKTS